MFTDDDELAFAIAHEVAHAALRHHVSQMRWKLALASGRQGERAVLETVKSAFDRDAEVEADRFGALYAVRAGYRFTATYEGLQRLAGASPGPRDDPSHPSYQERIEALKDFGGELKRSLEAFDRGTDALKAGKADEAIDYFTLFVGEFPNSYSGRVNLGAAYLARVRSHSGTPANLAEVLTILPDPGITLRGMMSLADVYRAQDHLQHAMRFAQPKDSIARAFLGLVYIRLREMDKARRVLGEALTADPRSPELHLCRGNVEHVAGRYDEAEASYREALGLRPAWPEAMKNLALTLEKTGNNDEALRIWKALEDHSQMGPEARVRAAALSVAVEATADAPER
jgi:predicted Zn-dependent protease